MKNRYDTLFITTLPAFYKVNLFNAISKRKKILVLYTGSSTGIRSKDFVASDEGYESYMLDRRFLLACIQLLKVVRRKKFRRVVVSGWDNLLSFLIVMLSPKPLNACIVESSILESVSYGLRAIPKKFLLHRVSIVYASGVSQIKLVHALGYSGRIIEFGGCGILNYLPQPSFVERSVVRNFLYVGQLIDKKNVDLIIDCFNNLPDFSLTIIGDGVMKSSLQAKANDNIVFLGSINNKDLPKYYQSTDVFILPSKIEPWGLVIEEALNNGTPVIVSSMVGCAESLVSPFSVGVIFQNGNMESLMMAIKRISNIDYYNFLRKNISKMDFIERGKHQVDSFLL